VTGFVNIKIKPTKSFGGTYRDRLCMRVFIEVSARTYMNIYVCTVFFKKNDTIGLRLSICWKGTRTLSTSSF
jgi:hypothetical protein